MQKGILLMNVGTPKSPEPKDVELYLREFLSDPDVISIPGIFRIPLVRWLIAPRRSLTSSLKYKKVWTQRGSPLLVLSQDLAAKLEQQTKAPVRVGMRYGSPSIREAIADLQKQGVDELQVVPMFPQFANATTNSCLSEFYRSLLHLDYKPKVKIQGEFFSHESFLGAVTARVENTDYQHILFSFHGLPVSHLKRDPKCQLDSCCQEADACARKCYRAQCLKTADLLAERMKIPKDRYSVSFQSRLGPVKWIEPYTDKRVTELAQSGVQSLLVLCPAFTTDCLETLEEISIEMRDLFLGAGGTKFAVAPCVNESDEWAKGLADILASN